MLLALAIMIPVPLPVHAAKTVQSSFGSPEEAVKALIEAIRDRQFADFE